MKEHFGMTFKKKIIDKGIILEGTITKEDLAEFFKATLDLDILYIDMGEGRGIIIKKEEDK